MLAKFYFFLCIDPINDDKKLSGGRNSGILESHFYLFQRLKSLDN